MSQWAWISEHYADVASDLSAFHRVDDPEGMDPQRFVDLSMLLHAYTGAVRLGITNDNDDEGETVQFGPAVAGDREVDSSFAALDPVLGQLVEVGQVEVIH